MVRLGLCCLFIDQPIKFRTTTATYIGKLPRAQQLARLSALCLANARALFAAIIFCGANKIGCFRVNSRLWPLKTHPEAGYKIADLPEVKEIKAVLSQCRQKAAELDVRLTFHPDQFVLLSSPRADVVAGSVQELDYQAEVASMIGADVINIHAGGGYGDKAAALKRMGKVLRRLKIPVRSRLTIENDDRTYSPADLLPFCRANGIPMVYDAHHHRCLPDGLSVQQATAEAIQTWDREPLFHISSPRSGWGAKQPGWHHDYIDKKDFPVEWRSLDVTVEVEAKAKELAVLRLRKDLSVVTPFRRHKAI